LDANVDQRLNEDGILELMLVCQDTSMWGGLTDTTRKTYIDAGIPLTHQISGMQPLIWYASDSGIPLAYM
jgi:hypothetical protein